MEKEESGGRRKQKLKLVRMLPREGVTKLPNRIGRRGGWRKSRKPKENFDFGGKSVSLGENKKNDKKGVLLQA